MDWIAVQGVEPIIIPMGGQWKVKALGLSALVYAIFSETQQTFT